MGMTEFLSDLWLAAKTAGPFGNIFLLIAIYVINEERKACAAKMELLTERLFGAMHDAADAIKDLRELFYRSGEKK